MAMKALKRYSLRHPERIPFQGFHRHDRIKIGKTDDCSEFSFRFQQNRYRFGDFFFIILHTAEKFRIRICTDAFEQLQVFIPGIAAYRVIIGIRSQCHDFRMSHLHHGNYRVLKRLALIHNVHGERHLPEPVEAAVREQNGSMNIAQYIQFFGFNP